MRLYPLKFNINIFFIMHWLTLVSETQLEEISRNSFDPAIKSILIFKHSSRCSTSSLSVNRLERRWDLPDNELPTYFLDLIKYPQLSSDIARIFRVRHESPQVLLIKDGKCIYT